MFIKTNQNRGTRKNIKKSPPWGGWAKKKLQR
jgi:hypothetical protein